MEARLTNHLILGHLHQITQPQEHGIRIAAHHEKAAQRVQPHRTLHHRVVVRVEVPLQDLLVVRQQREKGIKSKVRLI